MNFNKRQNEFRDIPGFDASRGERIGKALQKLWEKIQYLEQCRKSEKPRSEASCSSKDEDLTLTDIQYKLLLLQLQYARSLLKKNVDPNREVFHSKISEKEQKYKLSSFANNNNAREEEIQPDIAKNLASTVIQTAGNAVDNLNSAKESGSLEDNSQNAQVVTSEKVSSRFKYSTEEPNAVYLSKSKPHYHLKLDDVPFILGASSTASHSVVANVQNIIAMMKSHNKALCGPKPNVPKSTAASTHSIDVIEKNTGENSQDVTKLLNVLSRDLCELAVKQQKLAESIDATQKKKHDPEINLASSTQNQENKISYKHVENGGFRKNRSSSESEVKLHAEVKKMPKTMEKDLLKRIDHSKKSASNVRSQPSNLSMMDRRKLLRSLQNFKKHLSEEDISWN